MIDIEETHLNGVVVVKPNVIIDERGFFLESFNENLFNEILKGKKFVQDNHSKSKKNVLRGLHFQKENPQGKLVRCISGEIFDVAVDITPESDTFGKYFSINLSSNNFRQLWIPEGFAHGFCVLSDYAEVEYKCTDFYDPHDQFGIIWNDKSLDIDWPISDPILSHKDLENKKFMELIF